ncbi:MAG: flavin reductase family protein [Lachnospiraceae bacterium]|nr:flavin reductase family protein [Lachnospiraceae bacterium]
MSKQTWKPGNMLYPLPAAMVSVRDKAGNDNIITVAWTGTICTNPAMAYISVRPERHSYNMIKESGSFVINLTTKDLVWATDYCGVTSGRDRDKFADCKLHKVEAGEIDAPMIEESPVNIECKVREIKELGSHHMFIADVLAVHADEKYMDETGRFVLEDSDLICYSHGRYFSLGKELGTFGYSINKKKKRTRRHKS